PRLIHPAGRLSRRPSRLQLAARGAPLLWPAARIQRDSRPCRLERGGRAAAPGLRAMRALALLLLLLASPSFAETVHFPSATTPPTPLQQRLAKERGTPIDPQPTTDLAGELHRPAGDAPFPAVVALHGCGGRGPRDYEDALAARFVALGYVLLIVDSFGPRSITERCTPASFDKEDVDRVMDAYGGLN